MICNEAAQERDQRRQHDGGFLDVRAGRTINGVHRRHGALHSEHNILELCGDNSDTVDKMISTYLVGLNELSTWWLRPLLGSAGFIVSEAAKHSFQMLLNSFIRVVCALYYRIRWKLSLWPWRWGKIVDPKCPAIVQETHSRELSDANDCCLDDEFTIPARASAGGKGFDTKNVLEPGAPTRVKVSGAFRRCKCSNILSEDRVARATNQRKAAHQGRFPLASGVCIRIINLDKLLSCGWD